MSLVKAAIESGVRTDLPNAWKVKKGMGPHNNIPLAKGLFKQAQKMITMPVSHLKGDHKELEKIRATAKKVEEQVDEMEADDKKAKNAYKISG